MRDPAGGLPLALEVAGMDRSLPAAELGASFEAEGDRLRVLMVISRRRHVTRRRGAGGCAGGEEKRRENGKRAVHARIVRQVS